MFAIKSIDRDTGLNGSVYVFAWAGLLFWGIGAAQSHQIFANTSDYLAGYGFAAFLAGFAGMTFAANVYVNDKLLSFFGAVALVGLFMCAAGLGMEVYRNS
ncbi:MAG: hypothetical protein JWN64_330 [Parcubacteria group bacterium]|nr:hypothetical protein [Parcubacteria group bacterium]